VNISAERQLCDNNRKKLQFITKLTAILRCYKHRKQQKW